MEVSHLIYHNVGLLEGRLVVITMNNTDYSFFCTPNIKSQSLSFSQTIKLSLYSITTFSSDKGFVSVNKNPQRIQCPPFASPHLVVTPRSFSIWIPSLNPPRDNLIRIRVE